ncbi:MAG: hypothetical protein LBI28_01120 [Treponema sp.]|jgi:hypothetical protein|nr:hypothetical protein [Treponema sp.]
MKRFFLTGILIFISVFSFAQSFGFGDEEEGENSSFEIIFGGEISVGPTLYINDLKNLEENELFSIGDFISAYTTLEISGANAQGFIAFNLSYSAFEEFKIEHDPLYPPSILDEVWLKGYFGKFTLGAGLMKLRWGRMYSPGPLDVVNPLDYTDLTSLTEPMDMKIARPMIHASLKTGDFSNIEAVFLPNFAPHRFAMAGRWMPEQLSNITSYVRQEIGAYISQTLPPFFIPPELLSMLENSQDSFQNYFFNALFPDTSTSDFFQAGLRFNTVIGSCDFGLQYFYGNCFRPSVLLNENGIDDFIVSGGTSGAPFNIEYSRYHQIGIDYSQVLFSFTLRAEAAIFITSDLDGSNGNVKNPFVSWALGFDRDIFAGINLNLQCNETIRLFNDRIIDDSTLDCEAGTEMTSTRLILRLSKNFLRDKLETTLVGIYDIEDNGFCFLPSIAWIINDVRIQIAAGFFAGDENSELGYYRDNTYVKLKMVYSF